jgi:hypothetical protein
MVARSLFFAEPFWRPAVPQIPPREAVASVLRLKSDGYF